MGDWLGQEVPIDVGSCYPDFGDREFDRKLAIKALDISGENVGEGPNGGRVGMLPILDVAGMVPALRRRRIKIAILAIPADAAQKVVDLLVQAGVTSILNFAPTQLVVPEGIKVQNVDLSVLLKTLSYHTARAARS